MELPRTYLAAVRRQLDAIEETQLKVIEEAAVRVCHCLREERWIYVFGTGHSHMMAEELFYRAGGLARVAPILYPPLMLHESASASTVAERDLSCVPVLLERYPMGAGDVLLVASNSGRNPVPVELALQARERGVETIGLINRRHSARWPSRHPSGKKLGEIVDLVVDNCGEPGDACVDVPGRDFRVGAASTVTGAAIVQMIACGAIGKALEEGLEPEIYFSSNTDRSRENEELVEKYRARIRHL